MRIIPGLLVAITVILHCNTEMSAQSLISTAGGYYTGNGISLSWSLGEPVVETFSGGSVILTQGFQQPFFYCSQIIDIPAGWSGISTYLIPGDKSVSNMFEAIEPQMVLVQNLTGIYWPSQSTNTLGNWNCKEGYKIKMDTPASLEVRGFLPASKTITMVSDWSIMPVLAQCVTGTDVFNQVSGQLVIAKDVAGNGVYWPEFGINTLQTLSPGKAYFVKMNGSAQLTFPACDLKNSLPPHIYQPYSINPWNEPERSPASHVIAIPVEEFLSGDIIGAFTGNGICCGLTEITRKNGFVPLTVFGNNSETSGQLGFADGDLLSFRLFRQSTQREYILTVAYNLNLPNREFFADGGLSAIQSVTLSIPSIELQLQPLVQIWPNPNHGSFNVKINNVTTKVEVSLMTSQGQFMFLEIIQPENREISRILNFPHLPNGAYILRVKGEGMLKIERVVVN